MAKTEQPYPDTWYGITKSDEIIEAPTKKAVRVLNAKYYISERYSYTSHKTQAGNYYNFNEFKFYDHNFKPVKLSVDGVVLSEITKEEWDKRGYGTKHMGCTIQDKSGLQKVIWLQGGIAGIAECLNMLKTLSRFDTWAEYEMAGELEANRKTISDLEAENQKLKAFESEIVSNKHNLKKLYLSLFKKELAQGLNHLLNCEAISEKDVAIGFGLSQKQIKEIRSAIDKED